MSCLGHSLSQVTPFEGRHLPSQAAQVLRPEASSHVDEPSWKWILHCQLSSLMTAAAARFDYNLMRNLKPEMLHLADHSSIVTFPPDSKLNWENFSQELSHSWLLDPQKLCEIINGGCFKMQKFGTMCYSAGD